MKTIILILALLFAPLSHAWESTQWNQWDDLDRSLFVAASVATVIDWRQTQQVAKHPEQWQELNTVIGGHPTSAKINQHFALSIPAFYLGSSYMTPTQRKWYLGTVTAIELAVAARNYKIGVRIGF